MLKLFKFFNAETKVNKCLFSPHMCQALRPEQGGGVYSLVLCLVSLKPNAQENKTAAFSVKK